MQQLGIFPSFQYSDDPAVNPLFNAHVTYPPGMYQTSAQPPGAYYGSRADGLGGFWSSFANTFTTAWDGITSILRPGQRPMRPTPRGIRGLRGSSSIGSAVSGIGTLLVLGLATYGGISAYKKFRS